MTLGALRALVVVAAAVPSALRASGLVPQDNECFECIVKDLHLEKFVDVKSLAEMSQSEIAEIILENLLCDRCWPIRKQDLPAIYGCIPWVSPLKNDCDFILPETINDTPEGFNGAGIRH
ncbi:uncharacterized protein LOC119384998 [Rhipicephalus sanguineus]|uniref:uncharacterized protein LOC119384998 n=1 Tax=Rhipicephalus sanguineus TaxID=34632 RepID=UPI0020C5A781|nr:uncharacterized protein LOC119384998 [Rhipicephalus sanguineus]